MTVTKEMIEAADEITELLRDYDNGSTAMKLTKLTVALQLSWPKIRAALSRSAEAGKPMVKGLEWDECTQERTHADPTREVVGYEAGSPVGIFYGIRIEYDGFHASSENDRLGVYDSEEAAKAAAQADYETRVLSAISTPADIEE